MLDPWPDEPDEPSPETRWGNPERDLPRVPEVSTDESDVDPHTFKTFWVSVVFTNAAVFGVSLGAMLWYFRGQALLGGALMFVGILAGLRTYASYRSFRADDGESQAASADGGAEVDRSDPDGVEADGAETGPEADDRRDSAEGERAGVVAELETETETERGLEPDSGADTGAERNR